MKNVRIKVREFTCVNCFDYGIYEGKKRLMGNPLRNSGFGGVTDDWYRKSYAVKAAKAMAKRIGIPYDPEIIKQHGC